MGFGGGKSSSKSEPVTWKELMTPWQKSAMRTSAPLLKGRGMEGLAGIGLSPGQRADQTGRLMDAINASVGNQMRGLNARAGSQGLTGGALEESRQGIGAGGLNTLATGLRGIEDMNMQMAQQKIADFLGWMMWQPPSSMRSESSGFNMSMSV